jgi:hypothetical protein
MELLHVIFTLLPCFRYCTSDCWRLHSAPRPSPQRRRLKRISCTYLPHLNCAPSSYFRAPTDVVATVLCPPRPLLGNPLMARFVPAQPDALQESAGAADTRTLRQRNASASATTTRSSGIDPRPCAAPLRLRLRLRLEAHLHYHCRLSAH